MSRFALIISALSLDSGVRISLDGDQVFLVDDQGTVRTDVAMAMALLQRSESATRDVLERLILQSETWLERRGKKKGVTYHLAQNAAVPLQGSVVYTRSRDIDAVRWPEMIRAYVAQHGSINNTECRQLLGLGNSRSGQSIATRVL